MYDDVVTTGGDSDASFVAEDGDGDGDGAAPIIELLAGDVDVASTEDSLPLFALLSILLTVLDACMMARVCCCRLWQSNNAAM